MISLDGCSTVIEGDDVQRDIIEKILYETKLVVSSNRGSIVKKQRYITPKAAMKSMKTKLRKAEIKPTTFSRVLRNFT